MRFFILFYFITLTTLISAQSDKSSYIELNGRKTVIFKTNSHTRIDNSCLDYSYILFEPAKKKKVVLSTSTYSIEKQYTIGDPESGNEYSFIGFENKSSVILGLIDSTTHSINKLTSLSLNIYTDYVKHNIIGMQIYAIDYRVDYIEIRSPFEHAYRSNPIQKLHIILDELNLGKSSKIVIRNVIFQNPKNYEKFVLWGDFIIKFK